MCITEDYLLSREGRDGTNWPSRMKLWFKRNTWNLSMNLSTATILREIEDSGSEMELERRS